MSETTVNPPFRDYFLKHISIYAPFDVGKTILEVWKSNIIGSRDNAMLRMREGLGSEISQNENWVREGLIWVKKKGMYMVKKSPIVANAEIATDCLRNGEEFYPTNEQIEEALIDSVKFSEKMIETNRLAEEEIGAFAFEDIARKYGEFLHENGIEKIIFCPPEPQDKSFARQFMLYRLKPKYYSALDADYRFLNRSRRVCGVYESS